MTLANARAWTNAGYPMLSVDVDLEDGTGPRTAVLSTSCKRTLLAAGWLFLGTAFAGVLPPGRYHVPEADGGGTEVLEGFTGEPRLLRLAEAFLRSVDEDEFEDGPVEIPAQ